MASNEFKRIDIESWVLFTIFINNVSLYICNERKNEIQCNFMKYMKLHYCLKNITQFQIYADSTFDPKIPRDRKNFEKIP